MKLNKITLALLGIATMGLSVNAFADSETGDHGITVPIVHQVTNLVNTTVTISEAEIQAGSDITKEVANVCITTNASDGAMDLTFTDAGSTPGSLEGTAGGTAAGEILPYTVGLYQNDGTTLISGLAIGSATSITLPSGLRNDFTQGSDCLAREKLMITISGSSLAGAVAGSYDLDYTLAG